MKKSYIILYFSLFFASMIQAQTNAQGNLKKTEKNGKYGYTDETGNWVVPADYVQIGEFDEFRHPVIAQKEKQGNWGYVNCKGEAVTTFIYYRAFPFYNENLALVCEKKFDDYHNAYYRYGYINADGKIIIPVSYKMAFPFSEGLAAVKKHKGKKYGFIDRQGNERIDFKYDDVQWGFKEGLVWVYNGFNWGMINKNGVEIVYFQYSSISKFDPETGFADAKTSRGAIHYYDAKGNKFNTAKDRADANQSKTKPIINWKNIPSLTEEHLFTLNATVKSDSKIEYCKVYLNGEEVTDNHAPDGSAIMEDPKKKDNYDIAISRNLTLTEGIINTIVIKAKNAGGITEEQKKIVYKPAKTEPTVEAFIVWGTMPNDTNSELLNLNVTVKSTAKDVSYRVFLNGNETPRAKGSSIVEDTNNSRFRYMIEIRKTLTLQNGKNRIEIEVRNAKNELVVSEQKYVTYRKPVLAKISWGDMPSTTEEKLFTLQAYIESESPVEYYDILKNGKSLKKVTFSTASTGGSNIVEDNKNGKTDNDVQINEPVELDEGDNSLVLEVKNAGGIRKTQPINVHYEHKEKRIALVIGNGNYQDDSKKLSCPSNDADSVAERFRQLGFDEVIHKNNLPKSNFDKTTDDFREKSKNYDVVVVYYSGHGYQEDQINYFVPTDFDFSNGNITKDCVAVTSLLRDLNDDQMKIVVYDACRVQSRPKGDIRDIDVMNSVNTFIAYASAIGQPAYENSKGSYSIYTEAFLEVLKESNLELGDFFKKVNQAVKQRTSSKRDKQVPYTEGSLVKDFIFNKK